MAETGTTPSHSEGPSGLPGIVCSVIVTVYNHQNYLTKCLDGCLAQDTNFRYEILVGEDDSDDESRQICRQYAERYPDKIRLFLNSRENVVYINDRPTGRWNFLNLMTHAKGRYMAVCSGDDYWIYPLKLQKQVEFLEAHRDFAICHTRGKIAYMTGQGERFEDFPHKTGSVTTIRELLTDNDIITSSVMYRMSVLSSPPAWVWEAPMLDWPLHLLFARHGHIKRLEDNQMAVYRVHRGGVWSGYKRYKRSLEHLNFCHFLRSNWLTEELRPYIDQNIYNLNYRIAYSSREFDKSLFWKHYSYCFSHASLSRSRWRRVLILLLIYFRILIYDGQDIRLRFSRARKD